MPSHDNCYETAIRKFDDALKLNGNSYGPAYSNVIEGLQQAVQGLIEDRQMMTDRLAALESLLRNR